MLPPPDLLRGVVGRGGYVALAQPRGFSVGAQHAPERLIRHTDEASLTRMRTQEPSDESVAMTSLDSVPKGDPSKRDPSHVAAGQRVLAAMHEAGFSQQTDLADAVGLRPLTINRVINGRYRLTQEVAETLAPVLRRSVGWLMFGEENDARPQTPGAVGQYLASAFAEDISPRVAQLLQGLDFASLGLPNPGIRDVHRARELLEVNLALARQRRDE